ATVKAKTVNREGHLQALVDGKKVIISKSIIRRDLQLEDAEGVDYLPNTVIFEQLTLMGKPRRKVTEIPHPSDPISVADEAVNEEMDGSLEKSTTTDTSLDVEQDRGNISKTQSKATPNEPGSQGTSSGGGPRCQESIGDTVAQTRSKRVSKISNDLLPARVNTPRSSEDSLKLNELIELCTKLQQRVLDLETTKTTQALKIDSLKRRVKKLKRRKRSRTHGFKRLYKFGLPARVESSEDESLVNTATTTPTISIDEATLAQALVELKHAKPKAKAKGIILHDDALVSTHDDAQMFDGDKDLHGKEVFVAQDENVVKEEVDAAQTCKRERAQQEEEANIALIEKWDDVHVKIDAVYQLAERLQAEEQQELNDEENAKLFMQLLEKRRKFFAAKGVEEKRNKPPTRAQQKSIIEDLEVLWRLVKARFEKVKPVDHMDSFLLHNLKTMFQHHVEDNNILYYLLVEKMYTLTNHTIHQMFNDVKLQVDNKYEMAIELFRLSGNSLRKDMYQSEVFGSILLVINEAFNEET
nr:hypothetical protein [Tanacetum cinerariifolium]